MFFNLGGGGLGSFLPIFIVFFFINAIIQLMTGGLDEILNMIIPMTETAM